MLRGFSFYRDLQQRLAVMPGVRSVGAATMGPFGHSARSGNITIEGYPAKEDEETGAQQGWSGPIISGPWAFRSSRAANSAIAI